MAKFYFESVNLLLNYFYIIESALEFVFSL